jgi:farnesyl-diphosphate farnesyltransferase
VSGAPTEERLRARLLGDLLRRVSRSFYLTLAVVPAPVRDQIGLAYLFARAADTIADTDLIEPSRRLDLLRRFRAQFDFPSADRDALRAIQAALIPGRADSSERALLERLEDCFHLAERLTRADRDRIARVLRTLTQGMEMDLTRFVSDRPGGLAALETEEDLDRYTYYVAGCVGEFWTEMTCAHLPALAQWDVPVMAAEGVRFGKGLQLTNVLKDVAKDLARGRCYLPKSLLKEAGLAPADLLRRESLPALRPVLNRLIAAAVGHLDRGWLYTMAIPRREVRLRLACMWPILIGGRTLERISGSPDLLDPRAAVKIPKGQVYRIMAMTTLTGGFGLVGTAYWGRIRKAVGAVSAL